MSLTPDELDALKTSEQLRDFNHKSTLMRMEKYVDFSHAERLRSMDYMKEYGTIAIRSLLILNGGAIIALLTFIGSLLTRSETTNAIAIPLIRALTPAFLAFGFGLGFAAAIAGIAYLNFSFVMESYASAGDLYKWLSGNKFEARKSHKVLIPATMIAAIILAVASLAAFGTGSFRVYKAFALIGG